MTTKDRIVVLTGAAGRIGRAIAETFCEDGAAVALVDRNAEGLESLAGRLREAGHTVETFAGDLSGEAEVEQIVAAITERLGMPDALVNCAGRYVNRSMVRMSVKEWQEAFDTNVTSAMLMCRAFGRMWIDAGRGGSIVNISSGAGTSARAGSAHYAASKAAMNMLTEVLAIEYGPHGIRVNTVAPGVVLDTVVDKPSDDNHPYINQMLRATPLRRTGSPRDIANAVHFLSSDRAAWISGVLLPVSGGSHCGRTHLDSTEDATFRN
mgnify:CR=1 FL=1